MKRELVFVVVIIFVVILFVFIEKDSEHQSVGYAPKSTSFCGDDRFTNPNYFAEEDIVFKEDVEYAVSEHRSGSDEQLSFNIAYPSPDKDVIVKRPFILLIHGGGFREPDSERKDKLNEDVFNLAKMGFVSATIDYRLGRDYSENCSYDRHNGQSAIYRAVQDAKKAISFFVENADTYGIDADSIFIGGQSAGAITALNTTFIEQSEVDTLDLNLRDNLGLLGEETKIKGVISMWGGIVNLDFINSDIPTISFHGTDDRVVPYKSVETTCQGKLYSFNGSLPIHNKLKENNVCSHLYTKNKGAHGVFSNKFRIQKIGEFVKSVLCDVCGVVEVER